MASRKRLGLVNWGRLGLAVAVAAPSVALIGRLFAEATPAPVDPLKADSVPALSPADQLKQGVAQYKSSQYEEAVATLNPS